MVSWIQLSDHLHSYFISKMISPPFYIETPLIRVCNPQIACKMHAFVKMECLQPSGSFKDRGISHMINNIQKTKGISKLISSSGGNAGHAVATAGKNLGLPVDVYVPVTTKPMMIAKLKQRGANVYVHGANWNEADKLAKEALANNPQAAYIPPYDDPLIWEGNSTIVDELVKAGIIPDKIVLSVGGGGLLCGIQQGILRHGWQNRTKIVAVETTGTASFAAASAAGHPVALTGIDSVATSLGALSVTPGCLDTGVETVSHVVTDQDAVAACRRFADDFNILVEPACGAALSYMYSTPEAASFPISTSAVSAGKETVVVIACGGSVVNLELLSQWCAQFNLTSEYE